MTVDPIFKPWPKTPRFFRDCVVTEKIDGTNAQVIILRDADVIERCESGEPIGPIPLPWLDIVHSEEHGILWVFAGSRKRLVTPEDDNYGFAAWVKANAEALAHTLGPGRFHGEWYGKGIQRGYGLDERRFALFNVTLAEKVWDSGIAGLETVPVLCYGTFPENAILQGLGILKVFGTQVRYGSGKPEGVCLYHTASGQIYKALLENDDVSKTEAAERHS